MWYLREDDLSAYNCFGKNYSEDRVLFNIDVKVSVLKVIICEIEKSQDGVFNTLFPESEHIVISKIKIYLAFNCSTFELDKSLDIALVDYSSDKRYFQNSTLVFSNYETPISVLEEIPRKNPSLEIDIGKYKEEQGKCCI